MRDEFAMDAQRRQALEAQLIGIRIALAEAHEARDAAAALQALDALYAFRDEYPEVQVLYVPGGESSTAFALSTTCKQMVCKFGASCSVCSDRISRGTMMYWDPETRECICLRCSIQEFHGGAR
jgi:hypothetical protein